MAGFGRYLFLCLFAGQAFALDGICTRVSMSLEPEFWGGYPLSRLEKPGGSENRGIFTYTDAEGRPHIIKAFDVRPTDQDHVASWMKMLDGCRLMEKAGGPRLYAHGTMDVSGPPSGRYYYVDMARLPEGVRLKGMGPEDIFKVVQTLEAQQALPVEIARRLVDTLELAYAAEDPDLWIEPSGKATWIDGSQWKEFSSPRSDLRYAAGTAWYFLQRLQPLGLGKRYLDSLLQFVAESSMPSSRRTTFLDYFADYNRTLEDSDITPNWVHKVFRAYGIFPEEKLSEAEYQEILRAYFSHPESL